MRSILCGLEGESLRENLEINRTIAKPVITKGQSMKCKQEKIQVFVILIILGVERQRIVAKSLSTIIYHCTIITIKTINNSLPC